MTYRWADKAIDDMKASHEAELSTLRDRIEELERAADPVAWQFRYMSAANEWTSWRECSQSRYDNRQQDAAFRNGRVEFRELFTSPAAAESRLAEARADALELTEWERNELWLYADAGASFETYGPDERSKWKQLSDKIRALKSGGANG